MLNLVEAATYARGVERWENLGAAVKAAQDAETSPRFANLRQAVLAAKKAAYEEKGGAGSGSQAGHGFGGNRYTGGISEGGPNGSNPVPIRNFAYDAARQLAGRASPAQVLSDQTRVELNIQGARTMSSPAISKEEARNFTEGWDEPQANPYKAALLLEASQKYGGQLTDPQRSLIRTQIMGMAQGTDVDEAREGAAELLKAQYAIQQGIYKGGVGIGVNDGKVLLSRGIAYYDEGKIPQALRGLGTEWTRVSIQSGPLSSWTIHEENAIAFAKDQFGTAGGRTFALAAEREGIPGISAEPIGYELAWDVPTERIISDGIHGMGAEQIGEHVITGSSTPDEVWARMTAGRTPSERARAGWTAQLTAPGGALFTGGKAATEPFNPDDEPNNFEWCHILLAEGPMKVKAAGEKGGAGSGSQVGHGFGGNRYTGGISEGGMQTHGPRLSKMQLPPTKINPLLDATRRSTIDFDKIGNQAADLSRSPIMSDYIEQHVPTPDATPASHVKSTIVQTLAVDTGLTYDRANQMISTWARSSSDTTPDSVALQIAASTKFGIDPGAYLREQFDFMKGGYRAALEDGPPAPRTDVDSQGRLLMGPDSIEGHMDPEQNTKWNDATHALNEAIKMSMVMDQETSFVVPKEYMARSSDADPKPGGTVIGVDQQSHEFYVPFPGYGTHIYTTTSGWVQQPLEDGSVRFTRDNTLVYADDSNGTNFLQPTTDQPMAWADRLGDAQRVVGAIYQRTQAALAANGVKDMVVFRGMNWTLASEIPDALRQQASDLHGPVENQDQRIGTKMGENFVSMDLNPLSSFSVNVDAARQFGGGSRGVVLGIRVPADRIFSLASTGPGCLHEGEVVVVGGPSDLYGGRGYPPDPDTLGSPGGYAQSEFYG
jgi:hypothetical protein